MLRQTSAAKPIPAVRGDDMVHALALDSTPGAEERGLFQGSKGGLSCQPEKPKEVAKEWVRGDPGPFGLLCFGMTTCMLMFVITEWAEATFLPTVMMYAMFYGGFGQFVAGTLELIKGNTFGGTAFCSYGCFWMGWFLLEYTKLVHDNFDNGPTKLAINNATGKTLWCALWATLTLGFFVVTLNKNGCLQTIFSTLVITFSLLAGGVHNKNSLQAAGYIGFFCGGSAIYAAFAFLYKQELGISLPGVATTHYIA